MSDKPLVIGEVSEILGPHGLDPTDCPTFFDGCNCTVSILEGQIERALEAEMAREHFKAVLAKIASEECGLAHRGLSCKENETDREHWCPQCLAAEALEKR